MTNKRVIVVLSILAVFAVLLLVSSLVFKVKTIDVEFTSETTISSDEVKNISELKLGKSIFFINKKKATSNIESKMPYARVESIISKFPNKITIKISERVEEFFVKFETETNTSYIVFDRDLKILRIEEQLEKVNGLCEFKFSPNAHEVASKLDNTDVLSIINNFLTYSFDENRVKEHFSSIDITGENLIIKTNINTTITIKKYKDNQKNKIQTALSIFLNGGEGDSVYNKDFEV